MTEPKEARRPQETFQCLRVQFAHGLHDGLQRGNAVRSDQGGALDDDAAENEDIDQPHRAQDEPTGPEERGVAFPGAEIFQLTPEVSCQPLGGIADGKSHSAPA